MSCLLVLVFILPNLFKFRYFFNTSSAPTALLLFLFTDIPVIIYFYLSATAISSISSIKQIKKEN